MNDNKVMIAVIEEIEHQLTISNITGFEVSRNYQLSNQYTGVDANSVIKTRIFLHAIITPSLGRSSNYNSNSGSLSRSDLQHKSKTIQVSVLHYFDESDSNLMTTEDMGQLVRDLLDSPDAIFNLRAKNVYVQELGDVRPVFFVNDADRNESAPNFDLIVNYLNSTVKESGIVTTATGELERV